MQNKYINMAIFFKNQPCLSFIYVLFVNFTTFLSIFSKKISIFLKQLFRQCLFLSISFTFSTKTSVMGIEPTTFGLGGRCSTFELHELIQSSSTNSRYNLQLSYFSIKYSPFASNIIQSNEPETKIETRQSGIKRQFRKWEDFGMSLSSVDESYKLMITTSREILSTLLKVFPSLHPTMRKGENGRIAVIGGSFEFTGAPFYSAISSLKVGADLAHIFCSKSASSSIKSYSPEIIVHPVFVSEAEVKLNAEELKQMHKEWLDKIFAWRNAINAWIIGPGLGRDSYMNQFFPILIRNLPEGSLTILDADALYFLSKHPQLLPQLKRLKTILTPNARQLSFLKNIMEIQTESLLEKYRSNLEIQEIPGVQKFTDLTVFVKGVEDLILNNKKSFIVRTQGGRKRCGGIGDILSGAIAVCALWDYTYGPVLAARIVRMASKVAFEKEGRGLTAPLVVQELTHIVKGIESASL